MAWTKITQNFHVDKELTYMHDRMRECPRMVRSYVSGPHNGRSRTVTTSLVSLGIVDGWVDGKIPHTEAGHLVALELGGLDGSANLVPMYGGVNRGTYLVLEDDIAKRIVQAHLNKAGAKPAMLVVVHYPALRIVDPLDSRIPTAMDVYFHPDVADLPQLTPAACTLVRRIENTRLEPVRMDISGADIALRAKLMTIKDAFPSKRWRIEDLPEYQFEKVLPPLDSRPNAWLDWLVLTSHEIATAETLLSKLGGGNLSVGTYRGFAPQQRQLLAIANRMTQPDDKKGECWSDEATDPITSALTTLGTDDGIHVDHIFPMASGGPNLYSNAAITSALFNKQKGR